MATQELDRARAALAAGEWDDARGAFEELLASDNSSPEALDGLGLSLWWLKDVPASIEARTSAFRAFKQAGRTEEATRIAIWLARELRALFRNDAAAGGWLARAETLAADVSDSSVAGWIALARAESSARPAEAASECSAALASARDHGDGDLEIVSLARLGLVEIAIGEVDPGIKHLDESMAAGSAGEAKDPQSLAEAYCALKEAGELLGDSNRFEQWTTAMTDLRLSHGLGPLDVFGSGTSYGNLSVFCASCCGGLYLVTGRLDDAEDELRQAIVDLEASGLQSRCVHPVTQLAELRALQGRFEEARALLENYEDLPEAIRPLAVLDLALGEPESAAARLKQRIEELAEVPVGALPLHTVLVDAYLATGDLDSAAASAATIRSVATNTSSVRHEGEALFAEGKVQAARGDHRAPAVLRAAARALSEAGMSLTAVRARMELAKTLVDTDKPVAISEARAALAAFDRLGATPDSDGAAAFLRDLGVKGRTGPKNLELLTKREVEVLRLVAQGLSNPEIAERLFISVKTAGHHVSNILSKLGLRSRTEAAAFAAINLSEPATR